MTNQELYHLRILLLRVKGACSFEDLKTVDGELKESFTESCIARGLIENDNEWSFAMRESAESRMPRELRVLFVNILLHSNPIKPEILWEEFKNDMSEDFLREFDEQVSYAKSVIHIVTLLKTENKSLEDFPRLKFLLTLLYDNASSINSEYTFNTSDHLNIGNEKLSKMNNKQSEITRKILSISLAENNDQLNSSKCFFIDGPGGSGKTYIYETLWHLLRGNGKVVCTMAFTGIAATLLPEGKTVHKVFQLPVPLLPDSTSNIKLESNLAQYLKSVDIFVWDEAPMAPRYALEVVDRTLQDIMENDIPFGNKVIVMEGDFRQLLPVNPHGTCSKTVSLCINRSTLWSHFTAYSLIENMRVLPGEVEFSKFLLKVGSGEINDKDDIDLEHFPQIYNSNSDLSIAANIYGPIFKAKEFKKAVNIAILSARNADVNQINQCVVNLLDESTEKIYNSIDSAENCDNSGFDEVLLPEYFNTINIPSLPPYELKLRINTVVMLIRNLNINEGLCNGTRLLIIALHNHLLKCEILTGDKKGSIVFINRITLYSSETDCPFVFKRRQFSVKLAFAMTINKAQGQTFEQIGLDLRNQVFNHGQLYVALSRVRSWESLKIFIDEDNCNSLKNYVYKEIYE